MSENPKRHSLGVFNVDEHALEHFEFSFSETLTSHQPAAALPDTLSLSESITAYRVENGRTYHAYKDGAYLFPNDQEEIDRLRAMHEIFRRAMGDKVYFAPWTQSDYPRRVLDIGTGTGEWAFDFAEEFPQTEMIIGTDLSNIQPDETPPNVVFLIDDSRQEWLDSDLDYVHTRATNGCWEDMPNQIIKQAFDKLSPGGWLECQEPDVVLKCDDGTMGPDHALGEWYSELNRISQLANKPVGTSPLLKGWFEAAGFVDVQEKIIKLPTCAWPKDRDLKEIGWWMENMMAEHVSGLSRAYQSRVAGISVEEHELSLIPVRQAVRNRDAHTYTCLYVVWGRKPGAREDLYQLNISEPVKQTEAQDAEEN